MAMLGAVGGEEVIGEAIDRDGARVVLLARVWHEKVLRDHAELDGYLPEVLRRSRSRSRRAGSGLRTAGAVPPERGRPESVATGRRKL